MPDESTQTLQQPHKSVIEQTVLDNKSDIRDIRKDVSSLSGQVSDLRLNQQLTNQSITHFNEAMNNLKGDIQRMNGEMDTGLKDIQTEVKASNDKIHAHQVKQLEQYKTTMWTVGGSVTGSIVVGVIIFILNI